LPYLWKPSIPFSNEKRHLRYHDPKRGHGVTLDLRLEEQKEAALQLATHESLAEGTRLVYVALTRARHRCIVLWGPLSGFADSALVRLLHPRLMAEGDVKHASDAALGADLESLSRESGGAVTVRAWDDGPVPVYRTEQRFARELSARERSRALPGIYRTSSFSALTSAERAESPIDDAHDVDQDVTEVAEVPAPISEPPVPLDLFPRGPRAGDVLHAILEDADFEQKDPEELLRLSRQHLSRQGFDATEWAEPVATALADMLDTPLIEGDPSLRLSAVSRAQRVSEMEFVFPTGGARGTVLTPERLGKVLATREGELPAGYANSVAQLGFMPLAGYLRGFIDLVFEHGGRYYVVDYKSNHLGSVGSAYATRSLAAPMAHHHYFLQYHVYLVALHRHLSSRLPGYSYGKHMGGVLYLFFRGMAKERGHRTGVFFDRPSAQLVEELSRVLGSASGKKAG
jgi:exodeoxyribonuclease V beta subunit